MRWRTLAAVLLTVSLTAGGYLVGVSFCDVFKDTWLGSWCPDDPPGGGSSGAS